MYITGYHGTNSEAAKAINDSKEFKVSTGDKQWLGSGIYFFYSFEKALNWKYKESDELPEAVIHALIRLDEKEIFDIDTKEGIHLCQEIINHICKSAHVDLPNAQQNQCSVIKTIWDENPGIKMITCLLPDERTRLLTLMDLRKKHKEFCIRDNEPIAYLHVIQRGDIGV